MNLQQASQRSRRAPPSSTGAPAATTAAARTDSSGANLDVLRAAGIRAKLPLSQPDHPQEREADRMADAYAGGQTIYRQCASCSSEEDGAAVFRKPAHPMPTSGLQRGASQPLPGDQRPRLERFFQADLSGVRLHTDATATRQAAALKARAFTQGQDIWFGRGESPADERLLTHEVAHAVHHTGASERVYRDLCEDPAEDLKEMLPDLGLAPDPKAPPGDANALPQIETIEVSEADFEQATGLPATQLPDNAFTSIDTVRALSGRQASSVDTLVQAAPSAVGTSGLRVPTAMNMLPSNSIGILWAGGHQTLFANVNGAITMRGYRANFFWHAGADAPGSVGLWFKEQLIRGKPGAFRGDVPFLAFSDQSVIFLETDAATAKDFGAELKAKEYGGDYRYSPPSPEAKPGSTEAKLHERVYRTHGGPRVQLCTNNCITVPLAEVEAVLGTHPKLSTGKGVLDLATGKYASGAYSPHEHGRAKLMTEYMKDPHLEEGKPGLQGRTTTKWGGRAVGVIRGAGTVLLVVGLVGTASRLRKAYGTDDFPLVVADEAFTWTGGIMGAAVGGAIGGAVACAPTGPVTLLCAAGGFLGGLLVGAIGATLGSMIIPLVLRFAEGIAQIGQVLADMLSGLGTVAHASRRLMAQMFVGGPLAARYAINPCNWEWIGLSSLARMDINMVGLRVWSHLADLKIDPFISEVLRPLSSYNIPRGLLVAIANDLTAALRGEAQGGRSITADQLAGMSMIELVRLLRDNNLLRHRYDPEMMADLSIGD